jgi:hypothetical protein
LKQNLQLAPNESSFERLPGGQIYEMPFLGEGGILIEALIYNFIEAWLLGLIAFIAGRYVGRSQVQMPPEKGRLVLLYLQV